MLFKAVFKLFLIEIPKQLYAPILVQKQTGLFVQLEPEPEPRYLDKFHSSATSPM